MSLRNYLQMILANIQDNIQLKVLLKKADTMIVFVSDKERGHLFLSYQESHINFIETSSHRITISGSEDCIEEALMGKVPLRKLQKMKQLEIQGNFRQILLVEAILLLSRSKIAALDI